MWEHSEIAKQVLLVALVGLMLAVPLSCPLTKAALRLSALVRTGHGAGGGTRVPGHA
jgi:hypothetical protein